MKPYIHRIKYYETDRMGVTHHSNYIRIMEEARVEYLREIGWDYAKIEEMGIISPVTEVSCSYKKTTTFDDLVFVTVRTEDFTGVRLYLKYRMTNEAGEVVAECRSCHCFLDGNGRPIRLKRDYPDFYEALIKEKEAGEKEE